MADVPLVDVKNTLNRSKPRDFRAKMRAALTILSRFLEDNGLTNRPIQYCGDYIDDDERILFSELTYEGLALEREGAIGRWYDAHDRGRPPEDIRILERGLRKVRVRGPDYFLDHEWIEKWATPVS